MNTTSSQEIDELAECREELHDHARLIYRIFDWYAALEIEACLFDIGLNAYTAFVVECELDLPKSELGDGRRGEEAEAEADDAA